MHQHQLVTIDTADCCLSSSPSLEDLLGLGLVERIEERRGESNIEVV